MEIPELKIALQMKLNILAEDIAEKKRKIAMEEYDLNNHLIDINNMTKIIEPKD